MAVGTPSYDGASCDRVPLVFQVGVQLCLCIIFVKKLLG
jgi:hypothetical protein